MRSKSILMISCTLCILACAGTALAKGKLVFSEKDLKLPGKKGACWTLREPGAKQGGSWKDNLPKVKALDVSWNYSWGSSLIAAQPEDIEFVPMIWGAGNPDRLKVAIAKQVIPAVKSRRVKRLLGFNEPDGKKQSNLTCKEALKYWPILESAGVPLCSPAAVHADGPWMQEFMPEAEKRGYRVDYIGVHSYGGTSAKSFKDKMRKIYEKYDKRPLLITEFAAADWKCKSVAENRHSPAKVLAFMKEVLPWMEGQDWIAGYAWFSFGIDSKQGTSSALFDKDGKLTACGRYYKSVTTANPQGDQTIKPDPPRK